MDVDRAVRSQAFEWLAEAVDLYGEVLPRALLLRGFDYEGQRVPLVGPKGIFKPKVLPALPLSITTVHEGPYADAFQGDLLRYRYRGIDPTHYDNVALRQAFRTRTPLIYFFGIARGKYLPAWPVYIVNDEPARLTFTVAVDDVQHISPGMITGVEEDVAPIRRAYVTSLVRRRVHQQSFRERVLSAYRRQCSVCRLKHEELLDAAHIIPDRDPEGEPAVTNGISLCKLHHAAFDRHFFGIRPDYTIIVRPDVLDEEDGPMLLHGLQGIHRSRLRVPVRAESKPDPACLAHRFHLFETSHGR